MGRRSLNKVNGLCYTEDVFDKEGKKVTKLLFDNCNRLIDVANNYLHHVRMYKTSSYNSINRIARDILYLHNFLIKKNLTVEEINRDILIEFIDYLKKVKVRSENTTLNDFKRPKYAVENSLNEYIPMQSKNNKSNVTQMNFYGGLFEVSICRIFKICISYIRHLHSKGICNNMLDHQINSREVNRLLRKSDLEVHDHEIIPIEEDMILSESQIDEINKACSAPYERLLYFIMEMFGVRIGEAIGAKIFYYNIEDLRTIKGDIEFKDGTWYFKVVRRSSNPHYCRNTKSKKSRAIALLSDDIFTFERLLEKYLKWREKKVKKKYIEWLFISSLGNHLSQNVAYNQFKRVLYKALLTGRNHITLHSYRHTWATREILAGIPIELVSKALGHKNSRTTEELYFHVTSKGRAEIRDKYDKEWSKYENRYGKIAYPSDKRDDT